jgi:hypothetical protein
MTKTENCTATINKKNCFRYIIGRMFRVTTYILYARWWGYFLSCRVFFFIVNKRSFYWKSSTQLWSCLCIQYLMFAVSASKSCARLATASIKASAANSKVLLFQLYIYRAPLFNYSDTYINIKTSSLSLNCDLAALSEIRFVFYLAN